MIKQRNVAESTRNIVHTLFELVYELLDGMNKHQVSILLLSDLTSSFDTLDHDIWINRLHDYAGVGGIALQWFSSYVQNLCFFTSVSSTMGSATGLGLRAYVIFRLHSSLLPWTRMACNAISKHMIPIVSVF